MSKVKFNAFFYLLVCLNSVGMLILGNHLSTFIQIVYGFLAVGTFIGLMHLIAQGQKKSRF